jgi:acyl carrier protein
MQTVGVNKEELRALVAEVLELPLEEVTDDADFINDLEVDSLTALEIVVRLEKKYGVTMYDSELKAISSLNWVYQLLKSKLDDAT